MVISVAALAVAALSPAAVAAKGPTSEPRFAAPDLPNPLAEKQAALKASAQAAVLSGEQTPRGDNKVVRVAKGQFVELAFEGEDQILTLLAEFGGGDPVHPASHGTHIGDPFAHNNIPQPDRAVDNSTLWAPDFNKAHYENLLYNKSQRPSMANYYLEASSGSYSVDGEVGDWVTVPNNPSAYGSNYCLDIVCADTWRFVNDQADVWWDALVAQEGSVAAANAWLQTFDQWDRYDYNGNGDFDEPDGYIDHFQSVHAGEGEETGGGALGTNAIWSHRWYAYFPGSAPGPDGTGPHGLQGVKIGASNFWIGDYTVEPENGGVGVFTHEFGHDLNLPDEYDTSGNTGGAENSTGWWTTWSQGSYGSINNEGIGNYPVSMTAWERFQLGFLNYQAVLAGTSGTFHLGPVEMNSKKPQALIVVLPDKEVTQELGAPFAGANFYYSGAADDLDTTMSRTVTLPAGASLSAKVRYNIESGFDFAYVAVDGTLVDTNLSNSSVVDEGIEGISAGQPGWVDLTADLSAFTGSHEITFGYLTDGGVQGDTAALPAGFAVDNIQISGQPLDGAEAGAPTWTFDTNSDSQGFHVTSGTETFDFLNAYFVESRTYIGYDEALQKGPYNFGFPATPDLVEHFALQDGVVVWYWDTSYSDNNVGDHPGEGEILPVDSHPAIETWSDGTQMRPRIQSYDGSFTTTKTDAITLHNPANGAATTISSKPGVNVFNDGLRDGDGTSIYWTPSHPSDAPGTSRYQSEWNSVNVPNTGTVIKVKSISSTGMVVLDLNK